MDTLGLVNRISASTLNIDFGRKGFATRGKEQEGRISYKDGIVEAMSVFKEAQVNADPKTMLLAEYTFLSQELQFCIETDIASKSSPNQAIQSFDDAFLSLKVVEDKNLYQGAENTHPHNRKYRVSGFPKDSFHIACYPSRTRLQNILKAPGIDPIEKNLLKQRLINLSAAQGRYIEKQKKALEGGHYEYP